mmetsp:Transcript_99189/g.280168  ORF Transcript_99189/g.280168 Transcript_99189/m.280168 type:complete len:173 (+) Transcript_99189:76-594(+)|eukprot:CAMPEP_0117569470 /NCGR_PEP_ID=MMETSP0784-20121206/58674_1 /TAXON_ID=39447 /ORGANISM="" /LENGTH=172 /DNA_ID=CAMNT_0005367443 /DNA_START=71 /DNA_END=589 /DNA_ORIENTATION=-
MDLSASMGMPLATVTYVEKEEDLDPLDAANYVVLQRTADNGRDARPPWRGSTKDLEADGSGSGSDTFVEYVFVPPQKRPPDEPVSLRAADCAVDPADDDFGKSSSACSYHVVEFEALKYVSYFWVLFCLAAVLLVFYLGFVAGCSAEIRPSLDGFGNRPSFGFNFRGRRHEA